MVSVVFSFWKPVFCGWRGVEAATFGMPGTEGEDTEAVEAEDEDEDEDEVEEKDGAPFVNHGEEIAVCCFGAALC